LLDEIGKIFERILAARFRNFMEDNPSAHLSDRQYSFCEGQSTLDVLKTVVALIEQTTLKNGFAIGVSLDIRNAFNLGTPYGGPWVGWVGGPWFPSLPASNCRQLLIQGSVLGPFLWNLTYNYVLKVRPVRGCYVIKYADDTFIFGTETVELTRSRTNKMLALILRRFDRLGYLSPSIKPTQSFFMARCIPI